eukprot:TRINITY_DN8445_c0_g1_i1.p1 TRINITY_DN8445_c0_g1~~TRINITY_DN8445_c0_g1_i1.p1  ORF type:complete len:247 (-),score=40.48 TRINITY_DN8445_c0_g1_i1:52-792(-)
MLPCCYGDKEEVKLLEVQMPNMSERTEVKLVAESKEAPAVSEKPWRGVKRGSPDAVVYEITVTRKPTQSYGIDLSACGPICVVDDVDLNGLIGEHNASASPDLQVRRYDRLLSIDGYVPSAGKEIARKLSQTEGEVKLRFQRPVKSQATLKKREEAQTSANSKANGNSAAGFLGLELKEGPDFLAVRRVVEGPAEDYNASVSRDKALLVASRIYSVNGTSGAGVELMQIIMDETLTEATLEFMTWT